MRWFPYDLLRILFWPFSILFFPTRYYYAAGRPHNRRIRGGAIIVSNHPSRFDPVLIMHTFSSRRVFYLTGEILYEQHFLFSWFLYLIGSIRINRGSALDMGSLNRTLSELKAGRVVCVFPEGQISHQDDLLPFKSGVILMAVLSNTPIIPVYISDHPRPFHRLHIIVGKAIVPKAHLKDNSLTTKNVQMLGDQLHTDMLELKAELAAKMTSTT